MAAVLDWTPSDWKGLTLRELVDAHDSKMLAVWDHTAALSAHVYNLTVVVSSMFSKSGAKPKSMLDFHPFRKSKSNGMKIRADKESFKVLHMIGDAMAAGK